MSATLSLDGRVLVVTGAASGIGAATRALLAEAGAVVEASDQAAGDGVTVLDVTDVPAVDAHLADVAARHGRLDGVVNCAGVGVISDTPLPVGETTDEVWRRTLDVNVTGTFNVSRAAVAHLAGRDGTIVNIASVMGLVGNPGAAAYVTSKHAVLGLTKSMALEYADQGVRVNAICPGYIDTPMVQRYMTQVEDRDAEWAALMEAHPVGRLGRAEEVAAAALWLSSQAASFVTGIGLPVDGGFTAR